MTEAREAALANRQLARSGGDPLAEKRRLVGIPAFAEAAKIHVFPRIGDVAVSEVTSGDVPEILTPI